MGLRSSGSALRRVVYVNCDGLGARWISSERTPTLHALIHRGLHAPDHRAVFPSVTRPSAASVSTGCHPGRHGLQGNRVALVENGRLVVRDVGHPDFRTYMRRATGRTLRVPTLAERVCGHGGFVAFSNVSPGAAYFLDPDSFGFIYHRAGSYAPGGARIQGPGALDVSHDLDGDAAMTERFCRQVIAGDEACVSVLWLANPDLTLHSNPLGSPQHLEALRIVDQCLARVVAAVADARGRGQDVLLAVGSDHGQETIGRGVSVEAWLRAAGCHRALDAGSIAVAAQGTSALLYALPDGREQLLALLPAMGTQPWVGRIITGSALAGIGHETDGTLAAAIDMAREDHVNPYGVEGQRWVCTDGEKPAATGCGQHGGLGPDETHPFLVLEHPLLETRPAGRPSSLVDIAPTALAFLELPTSGLDGSSLLS